MLACSDELFELRVKVALGEVDPSELSRREEDDHEGEDPSEGGEDV